MIPDKHLRMRLTRIRTAMNTISKEINAIYNDNSSGGCESCLSMIDKDIEGTCACGKSHIGRPQFVATKDKK